MEAKRVSEISTSMIRRMFEVVEQARKSGKEIINLTIGEPDFDTHLEIIERAYKAMKEGYTHYTSNFGIAELREVIAERYGVSEEEVMITCGASEALLNTSLAFIEENSEVVIPTPSFLSYFTYSKLCNARVKPVDTSSNNFELKAEDLNETVSDKTSLVFLNYPNNPTGAVLDQKAMNAIAEVCEDKGIILVSDEVYDSIYYDKKPGTLAGKENVVVINAFSKSLAMTGWRIGYIIANKDLLDSILKVHQVNGVCAPAFAQKAVYDVIKDGLAEEITKSMVREFRKRRDFVYDSLKDVFKVSKPEGAFYIFPQVENPMEFAEKLLAETGVAVTPGNAFGSERNIRISYASSMENLEKAMEKIRQFAKAY
ncbi:Aspartate/tyrosine/aromatic aminotransferase [Archaeoglobus sulfaticallidus PM70-1]|uniref:Aspartate/tyrosine/aromatic aminotransferase n=1 Tax=Archaeoglobus sulfaticallidus PM70-1 TaxID=387631 RepID=N0BFG5_9EURY|nr:aminotransferase class I/II-fold pyridoxal phosphate-dependent enzyme [Archaeoglobus sulfaticallidus]AGK60992.1 Aspartate/tyrosine/aromatic aminotransferase [Archaeoglobus sulfaticallidus PM70-1]